MPAAFVTRSSSFTPQLFAGGPDCVVPPFDGDGTGGRRAQAAGRIVARLPCYRWRRSRRRGCRRRCCRAGGLTRRRCRRSARSRRGGLCGRSWRDRRIVQTVEHDTENGDDGDCEQSNTSAACRTFSQFRIGLQFFIEATRATAENFVVRCIRSAGIVLLDSHWGFPRLFALLRQAPRMSVVPDSSHSWRLSGH